MKSIASGLKALCLSAALLGSILPTALARPKKHDATVKYKAHCGMVYSAADAKKYHYVCPMDHKPLMKMPGGVTHKKGGMGGGWYLRLPGGGDMAIPGEDSKSPEGSEDSQSEKLEPLESSGECSAPFSNSATAIDLCEVEL